MTSSTNFHEMRCKSPHVTSIIRVQSCRDPHYGYLKNGRYAIDNIAAERAIRPFTIERKKSNSSYGQ